MREKARATQQQTTKSASTDHHAHGLLADSPLALLALTVLCSIAYFLFSQLQITSTEQTVFNLLQLGVQLKPGLTATQAVDFVNGQLDRYHLIAAGIGWGVQIALTILSFPPDSALLSLHRRYTTHVSASLTRSALTYAKWHRLLMIILIGGDVLTDFWYVAQGHTLITWSGVLPTITSSAMGVILVGIVYPAAICFVTIFVGKYMFVYLDALYEKLRGTTATA